MTTFDLSGVRFVKRIVVGTDDPSRIKPPAEIQEAQALLNRCLNEHPSGKILGIEKGFVMLNVGEHQIVLQWLCYHIGFPRKPHWLPD